MKALFMKHTCVCLYAIKLISIKTSHWWIRRAMELRSQDHPNFTHAISMQVSRSNNFSSWTLITAEAKLELHLLLWLKLALQYFFITCNLWVQISNKKGGSGSGTREFFHLIRSCSHEGYFSWHELMKLNSLYFITLWSSKIAYLTLISFGPIL